MSPHWIWIVPAWAFGVGAVFVSVFVSASQAVSYVRIPAYEPRLSEVIGSCGLVLAGLALVGLVLAGLGALAAGYWGKQALT